jgi:anti-anti-sigma factor
VSGSGGGGQVRVPQWEPGRFAWSQLRIDDCVVVLLAGELDLSTAAELRRRLMSVVEADAPPRVVLDMSGVRYIDAHSIGLIVGAWSAAKSRGRQLYVDGLCGIPAQLFGLLGLEPMLVRRTREAGPGGDVDG